MKDTERVLTNSSNARCGKTKEGGTSTIVPFLVVFHDGGIVVYGVVGLADIVAVKCSMWSRLKSVLYVGRGHFRLHFSDQLRHRRPREP